MYESARVDSCFQAQKFATLFTTSGYRALIWKNCMSGLWTDAFALASAGGNEFFDIPNRTVSRAERAAWLDPVALVWS